MLRSPRQIQRMFGSIAHRYDFLNHLLSLSIDRYWRWLTTRRLASALDKESLVLDLCTGTGDLAFSLSKRSRVIGCDFSHEMLVIGRRKAQEKALAGRVRFVEGDALQLPFESGSFRAVTIAFGLRNLAGYSEGLEEMFRILQPAGLLAVLEFSQPRIPILRQLYFFYFTRILPWIGERISGREGPYAYLPESVKEFPSPPELDQLILHAGFRSVQHERLSGGIATLHLAEKADR
ncbi:MAG: bifunctional demethylmenaquinone methyltransferase/2-methoxy-6-polyprenyl-1,4-benzoquinol methylase UbiE [Acidobacteriota bacterium]